jgi:hypothetical protein
MERRFLPRQDPQGANSLQQRPAGAQLGSGQALSASGTRVKPIIAMNITKTKNFEGKLAQVIIKGIPITLVEAISNGVLLEKVNNGRVADKN